jgi:hypothetical protein
MDGSIPDFAALNPGYAQATIGHDEKWESPSDNQPRLAWTPNSSYDLKWTVAGTFLSPPAPGFRPAPKPRFGGV